VICIITLIELVYIYTKHSLINVIYICKIIDTMYFLLVVPLREYNENQNI